MSAADLAADNHARRRAVDPACSVILQAPAGSGKTTVLIERLLVLLAQAEAPEEILAITFTRKAAAEMALRVAQALNGPGELAAAVRARSQQRGWRLLENPARLRIQTLDALNRALALQMPLAARGSGSLQVLPQAAAAYRSAARRALLDAQSEPRLRPDVELLFERMENDFARCEQLLAGMLERRTHWLPYLVGDAAAELATRVRDSLEAVVQARLAQARRLLAASVLQEGLAIAAAAARHSGADAVPPLTGEGAPTLRQWQALCLLALTKEGSWRKRLDVRGGFPPGDPALKRRGSDWIAQLAARPGVLELFNELQLLPDPQLSADEIQVLGVLARLLELAVAELDLVFNELGRVDYPAVAVAARTALGSVDEPTDLTLRLDSRLRHILVDEFQDTSLEQTRLLELLTAGWVPGDGRTLFLVGDPMQSIYGFREAEVGMFLAARTSGIGTVMLEPLALRCNFRSAPEVVQWNNEVFARCFPEADDPRTSAVAYAPSIAARAGNAAGAVHLHRVLPGDAAGEACAIARIVAQLREDQPQSSIAILLSARSHAGPIVAALAAARLEVAGVNLVSLEQLSMVRDLGALTCALDHLADRTAWLALLRAPWCGLSLAEISQVVGAERHVTIWERLCDPQVQCTLAPPAQARVQRLQQALAVSLDEMQHTYASGREGLARRVESAWLRLGGPAACAQEADLGHARAFLDALAQWCGEPDWSGPRELPQRLTRLFAAHPGPGPQAVQIMTIHHAKGLEFDHVILPGLGRKRRAKERSLLQWLDLPRETRGSDLLMVAVPPAAATGPTALGRYVTRLQEQRERHEATRLLYVAATRARLQLHLFGQLEDAEAGESASTPRAGTLLERLWPALRDRFPQQAETAADTALPQDLNGTVAATPRERLSAQWQVPQPPPGPQPVMLPIAAYEPPAAAHAAEAPNRVEQAVCEVLRSLARRRRPPPYAAEQLTQLLNTRLQGVEGAQALELLQACLTDSRLQWIFTSLSSAAETQVPLALTGMFGGRLTSIRADLSFKDAAGTQWLIDIAPRPPQSLEDAFALRLARHLHLAQALDAHGAVRAAVYLPAAQLFWTGAGA
jgi:ATP-dependent helicase/nuclease subunit A